MKLSVVIISWNTKDLLRACLQSLRYELGGITHEVILVDNASTDGSQKMVKQCFSEVNLVENDKNVGFSKANNQVLLKCHGKYLMLLNPDTVVLPGSIRKMIEFLDHHGEYGAVGPKILRPDGSIQMECASNFPTLWNMLCELTLLSRLFRRSPKFGDWRMTYWDHKDSRDVECLLGAAILIRRSILNDIGLLDEHMYIEDEDLCFRIRKIGWKIRYLSEAEILHHDGASRKQSPKFYHHYQIAWHGLWHFFRKHKGTYQAQTFRLMTFVCSIVGLIFFLLTSWFTFFNRKCSVSFRDRGKKAWAVFLWSITRADSFKIRY